ncbi:MAG: tetratricopeptide repeat protein [Syntrophobacterales bacterium]|jgi:Flp pilus assembly protein TadD
MKRLLLLAILIMAVVVGPTLALAGTAEVVKEKSEAAFRDYVKAGNLLAGEAHYTQAAEYYRKALSLKPKSAEAYSLLGSALAEAGNSREAEQALRKSVALKPDFAEGYYHLGNFLKSQGKQSEAEEAFRKAEQYRH